MTLKDLQQRHSVRSYTDQPLSDSEIKTLRAAISEVNSYLPGTRFQLVLNDDTPFTGKMGSYGMFKGVRNYIAAVIDTGVDGHDRIAGYAGQKIVMEATLAGLGTCFIGGTFSSDKLPVQMRAGEVIRFIIAVGHKADNQRLVARLMVAVAHRKHMSALQFFDSDKSAKTIEEARKLYPALDEALEAIACAPSAMNARPARIWLDADGNIMAGTVKNGGFTQVDLGIALFNFEQIIPGEFTNTSPAQFTKF